MRVRNVARTLDGRMTKTCPFWQKEIGTGDGEKGTYATMFKEHRDAARRRTRYEYLAECVLS